MIFNETTEEGRSNIIKLIKHEGFKRVLDVGGSMFPWAGEVVTHYLDGLDIHDYLKDSPLHEGKVAEAKCFVGDINDEFGWLDVFADVRKNGLFDFVICTQTLEDIRNPSYPLKIFPKIATQGFISVPHKYRELAYVEGHAPSTQEEWNLCKPYIGYFHHRWIFTVFYDITTLQPKLRLFPKLEFIMCMKGMREFCDSKPIGNEMSFRWISDIPFEIVNGDYLGPNPPTVFSMYKDLLREGI